MLANLMLGESRYRGSRYQVAVSVLPAHRFCGHHRQQSISHKEVLASPCIAESHFTWVVAGSCPMCRSEKGLLTVAICRRAFNTRLQSPPVSIIPAEGAVCWRRLVLATHANGTTVTPECGSCAPGISPPVASAYDADASGLR